MVKGQLEGRGVPVGGGYIRRPDEGTRGCLGTLSAGVRGDRVLLKPITSILTVLLTTTSITTWYIYSPSVRVLADVLLDATVADCCKVQISIMMWLLYIINNYCD